MIGGKTIKTVNCRFSWFYRRNLNRGGGGIFKKTDKWRRACSIRVRDCAHSGKNVFICRTLTRGKMVKPKTTGLRKRNRGEDEEMKCTTSHREKNRFHTEGTPPVASEKTTASEFTWGSKKKGGGGTQKPP